MGDQGAPPQPLGLVGWSRWRSGGLCHSPGHRDVSTHYRSVGRGNSNRRGSRVDVGLHPYLRHKQTTPRRERHLQRQVQGDATQQADRQDNELLTSQHDAGYGKVDPYRVRHARC